MEPEPAEEPTMFRQAMEIGDFTILGRIEEYAMHFQCWQASGSDVGGKEFFYGDSTQWMESSKGFEAFTDPQSAIPFLSGWIKWDGCSDVRFDEQTDDNAGYHFCGRENAARVGELFNILYDLAEKLIPRWGGNNSLRPQDTT